MEGTGPKADIVQAESCDALLDVEVVFIFVVDVEVTLAA
jgi:hypothetical protein